MPAFRLSQRTLVLALRAVGNERSLARRLRVPEADLAAWLAGKERAPMMAFLGAVDILADLDVLPSSMPERDDSPDRSAP
jgi:hypothetical protein